MRVIATVVFLVTFSVSAYAEDVWVQVRESRVRSKPLFYASGVSTVRYGDKLSKTGDEGGWAAVKSGGFQGYLPLSAISRQHIVLSAKGLSRVEADSSDVVLAGKGFSREVEQSFRTENRNARYDLVDKVEQVAKVSTHDVEQFVNKGGLHN
jgi:hypothetical protein